MFPQREVSILVRHGDGRSVADWHSDCITGEALPGHARERLTQSSNAGGVPRHFVVVPQVDRILIVCRPRQFLFPAGIEKTSRTLCDFRRACVRFLTVGSSRSPREKSG
jgi:hypothetical protein